MALHSAASRYFGSAVSTRVTDAIDDHLLDHWVGDRGHLVDAHLALNYPYFGAIDKSLSGFVILDDEGDDYTLLDLRGTGRVWWQDHETRELELCFDSFDDWLACQEELGRAEQDDADDRSPRDIRNSFRPHSPTLDEEPTPGSAELAERYQWLMWLLARPLLHDGQPMQDAEDLASNAAGHFSHLWDDGARKDFEAELPLLHRDPHLAIYWLLHTSLLANDADRARVLDEIARAESRPELLDAFVEVFGALAIDGTLTAVTDFRIRRSLLLSYLAPDDDSRAQAALTALEMAPDHQPLGRASWIIHGLESATFSVERVLETLDRVPDTTGTALLRADTDRRAGRDHSPAADTLVRLLSASTCDWQTRVWALSTALPLVRDGVALAEAARDLLTKDPYSRPCLTALLRAHELCGAEPVLSRTELDQRVTAAESSAHYLVQLREQECDHAALLDGIDRPELADVVAQRILLRADLDKAPAEAIGWALRTTLDGTRADRAELAAIGLGQLPAEDRTQIVGELRVDAADSPLVPVLIRLLEHTPEPHASDILGDMQVDDLKETVCAALAPVAHQPPVFDELMRLTALPAPGSTVEALWNQLFDASEEDSTVRRLSPEQAGRAAAAMIDTVLTHPAIGARNAAGHQLYRFDHRGAQDYLIAALDEYGQRYAESDPADSPVLSHGQTLDSQLEDVVANLYSAVRAMDTTTARTALIERLFTERRSIWRMGNAIGKIFSAEVHREVMRALRDRRDARAAGHYANALADHVGQRSTKVELLQEIVDWPTPVDETDQRVFAYALIIGVVAAMEAESFDLVRAAHARLEAIPVTPAEPDSLARGRDWTNPLDTDDLRTRLAAVLSGEADSRRNALLERGARARGAGRPLTKISDDDLSVLAGTSLRRRLLSDPATGRVWFLDSEGDIFAFDGFGMSEAPFLPTPIGYGALREFLGQTTEQSERTLLWTAARDEFVELVRYLDRIVYRWGVNNGRFDTIGLAFPDASAAETAFAAMKATSVAAKYTESDPWYLPGRAAIQRTFARADGESEYLMAFDRLLFAVDPAAAAAHERRELELYRDGARLSCLESVSWDGYRLRTELTVAGWVRARIRNDAQDPAWHVTALAEIAEYLVAQGFTTHSPGLAGFRAEVGAPASDAEIDALEAELGAPLPESLRTLWQHVGHAEWRVGDIGMRLLGPAEVRRELPRTRAAGREYTATLRGERKQEWEPVLSTLSPLVLELDGTIDTVFAEVAAPRTDDRVFAHLGRHPAEAWWERSLSWILATSFLSQFADRLERAVPEIMMLSGGQRRGPELIRRYFEATGSHGTKFWEIVTDPGLDVVATRYGKVGTEGTVSVKRCGDPGKAAAHAAKMIAAKEKSGYRESAD
ncbi:SMI1/KNR4 family protein [Nocardia sp. NPDC050793]|uniref:SMI1/KNR4 family protein n=1 Tax=Nocardia sp. NPDC050793 TaxID=3155159 RepID=UPI0033D4DF2C